MEKPQQTNQLGIERTVVLVGPVVDSSGQKPRGNCLICGGIARDDHHVFALTDAGNAARFTHLHHRRFRYVAELDRWFRWDGKSWGPANRQVDLVRAAIDVANQLERDTVITHARDEKLAQALDAHAHRTQSEGRLNAMISLARAMPALATSQEQLDREPFLLSCENGTIDLRTGMLRPPDRDDLITARSPVAYDPDATCPRWNRFLAEVFEPNPDAAVFIQRFAGYSLTRDTSARCLLFAHGSGSYGKRVLFRQIERILGHGLAMPVPPDTFAQTRRSGARLNALSECFGKRAVFVEDCNQGGRLAEGLLEQLTAGERVSARRPYGRLFNYTPAFKLWMSGDQPPRLRGNGNGIWRHFKLVPFKLAFQDRCDDKLDEKLADELPGILAWAVRGCLDWLAAGGGLAGLGDSPTVDEATASARSEGALVTSFLQECCVTDIPEERTRTSAVYEAYRKWVEQSGRKALSRVRFGREMTRRGLGAKKSNGVRYYPLGHIADRGG